MASLLQFNSYHIDMARILIVENEDFLRDLYSEFLTMSKFDVKTAEDGEAGLEKLKSFKPDLILLDILMPVLNGIEFLESIKKDLRNKDIPVLLLTGVTDKNLIQKCMDLGAVGCVMKTTHPVELLNRIEAILDKNVYQEEEVFEYPLDKVSNLKNISD